MISRKQFLFWSTAFVALSGLFKFQKINKIKKTESSKFLTEDGILVEVNNNHSKVRGTKIYTSELKNWIKNYNKSRNK